WSPADLLRMLGAVTELEPRFRKSAQQQILVETLLVHCALIDRAVMLEDVLRGLGGGGSPVPPGPSPSASPRSTAPLPTEPSPAPRRESGGRGGGRGDVPDGPRAVAAIDGEALVARWPEIVATVRRERQSPVLAAALEQSVPRVGATSGLITLQLAERNDILSRALQAGQADIVAALRDLWPAVERVAVVEPPPDGGASPPRRLSVEAVRADQVAAMRKGDAVLGAAIDALDLELIE